MSTPYSFGAIFAYDQTRAWLTSQIDQIADTGSSSSLWMSVNTSGLAGSDDDLIQWSATLVCVPGDEQTRRIIVTGPGGIVLELTKTDDLYDEIDPTPSGPSVHGAIRDLRIIGDHVYATGMRRQVYRREQPRTWVHIDQGVLQPPVTTEIAGFNSIDGLGEDELYAAGFGGEIWRRQAGTWRQIDSPTNVILNKVLAVEDRVYICGQAGMLLEGRTDGWHIVDTADEDLWDMAWFNGQLWLAGDDHLFVLDDGSLSEVDVEYIPKLGMTKQNKAKFGKKKQTGPTVGALSTADGVLWSAGPKHVLWTDDGRTWTEVTP